MTNMSSKFVGDEPLRDEPTGPMRVFCPKHDEFRAVYTMGRPMLDDRCPRCIIEELYKRIGDDLERRTFTE